MNAATHVGYIIANVNSGPGTNTQSDWTTVISNAVSRGIRVYGYVYTSYGNRNGAEVDSAVATWIRLYPQIHGIFLDETASGSDRLSYYQARYNYIKSLAINLAVVINPGTITDEGYMGVSDVNTMFEGTYNSWNSVQFPAWISRYPQNKFSAIIYGVPGENDMRNVLSTAVSRNIGTIFVTNGSSPSAPLPIYFQAEANAVSSR